MLPLVFFNLVGGHQVSPPLSPYGGVGKKQALSCASSEFNLDSIQALLELSLRRLRMDAGWRPTTATMADGRISSAYRLAVAADSLRHHLRVVPCLLRRRFSALVLVEHRGPRPVVLATLWLTRWSSHVSSKRKSREPKVIVSCDTPVSPRVSSLS
jgi:hypothetical protein